MLPYALAGGPLMERILRDIYGIEFFHPPGELRGRGALSLPVHEALWQTRTSDEWRKLGALFGLTGVLVPAGWRMDLPLIARSDALALYDLRNAR